MTPYGPSDPAPYVDIIRLVAPDTRLHRVTASEQAGACPFCGGTDRFRVSTKTNRWWCRQCSPTERWSSPADYLIARDHLTDFAAACRALEAGGVPPLAPPPPAPPPKPDLAGRWQEVADACRRTLWDRPDLLEWLCRWRQITPQTALAFELGVCLPEGEKRSRTVCGLQVPAGVTIPLRGVDGALYGVKVRRNGSPKYSCLPGSGTPLYGRLARAGGLLVATEGEFDAMLAYQAGGGAFSAVTMGGASTVLGMPWLAKLNHARERLVVRDADAAGAASRTYAAIAPGAEVRVPSGKDLTEYARSGADVGAWLMGQFATLLAAKEPPEGAKVEQVRWKDMAPDVPLPTPDQTYVAYGKRIDLDQEFPVPGGWE